jgi:hypothetical protein
MRGEYGLGRCAPLAADVSNYARSNGIRIRRAGSPVGKDLFALLACLPSEMINPDQPSV